MTWEWAYLPLFFVAGTAGWVDAMAGGGGLITLPSLFWFGLSPQLALGTNKLQSSCGTSLAAWRFWQAGLMKHEGLWMGIVASFLASMAGSFAATQFSPDLLKRLVPVLLVGVAAYLTFSPRVGIAPSKERVSPWVFGAVFGLVLGFYDGFFGPGTGSFWMASSMGLLGLEIRSANAYTKAMNLSSNLASVCFFASQSKIHYPIALTMAAGQLVGAQLGSRMAIKRGAQWIRPMLLTVVLLMAARLLWQTFH